MILLLLGWGVVAATPLERHQYRVAAATLRAVLQTDDQPVWYARLGSAEARLGHYGAALEAFALGIGSPWYERTGWRDHANVLRAVGRCAEAAELRQSFEGTPAVVDPAALWADIAEDWRACGASERALDAVAAAEARSIDHPIVQAVLSDLLRDQGHWVAAGYHAQRAVEMDTSRDIRPELSVVEHQMQSGDPAGLDKQLLRLTVGHGRDPRLFLARTEFWLRTGQLDEASALASRGPWSEHEDPRVLCRRHAVYTAGGEVEKAAEVLIFAEDRRGRALQCEPPRQWQRLGAARPM